MFGIRGSAFDPVSDQLDLLIAEPLSLTDRGHPQIIIGGNNSLQQIAVLSVPRGDGGGGLIQTQIGFASVLVRPVTSETMIRQDRLDVAAKVNFADFTRGQPNHGGAENEQGDDDSMGAARQLVVS
jgi:hypothetical protein